MPIERQYGGNSMVAPLRRVLICPPYNAGWDDSARAAKWQELNYLRPVDFAVAQSQHDALRAALEACDAEVLTLPADAAFSLDAVYCHDASLTTDRGIITLRMGKSARTAEPAQHAAFCSAQRIPLLGEIHAPAMAESGDLVWLDSATLLAGRGYRTNAEGIAQLRGLLAADGVEVIAAPLPYGPGPCGCMHLMSLMSMLDEGTVLVDLPLLAVETVELLRARGLQFVEIDPGERGTLACNVLSLGHRRLLALEENAGTNARLRDAGFDVRTFPGSEIAINGGGGPTCLTRPLLRG